MKRIDKTKLPGNIITVIIRNDASVIFCESSPAYRSVRIELTEEQREKLTLKQVGVNCGHEIFETISQCFIETGAGEKNG